MARDGKPDTARDVRRDSEPVGLPEHRRCDGLGGPSYLWQLNIRRVAFVIVMVSVTLDTVLATIAFCRQRARRPVTVLTDFQLWHQDVFDGSAFERRCAGRDMMALDTSDVSVTAVVKAAVREPTLWDVGRNNLKAGCRVVADREVALLTGIVLWTSGVPRDGLEDGGLDQPQFIFHPAPAILRGRPNRLVRQSRTCLCGRTKYLFRVFLGISH